MSKRTYVEVTRCLVCFEDLHKEVVSLQSLAVKVIIERGIREELAILEVMANRSSRLQCVRLCVDIPFSEHYGFPWIESKTIIEVLKMKRTCIKRRRILCGDLKLCKTVHKGFGDCASEDIYLRVQHVDTDVFNNKLF